MKSLARILIALVPFVLLGTAVQAETFVRMVSGPAGGSWYPLGAKIAEVLGSEVPDISTSNGPGGGVGNVKDVNSGNAELGWTYAHTAYNGFSGKGKFDTAQPNVRHFATLYPAALQTAVPKDSDIQSFADMKDKNLSPGKKTFSGYAAAELVFKHYGLNFDQVKQDGGTIHYVGYTDSAALMKDGHLDAAHQRSPGLAAGPGFQPGDPLHRHRRENPQEDPGGEPGLPQHGDPRQRLRGRHPGRADAWRRDHPGDQQGRARRRGLQHDQVPVGQPRPVPQRQEDLERGQPG
jgi:hypothetical protein